MKFFFITLFLTKAFFTFCQTQHINQLIENVLPDFINSYNNNHHMNLLIIENSLPYKAVHSLKEEKVKYVEGLINGGLKDGYYCDGPSAYLVSCDTLRLQFFLCGANKQFPGLRIGDTVIFNFVYREHDGLWAFDNVFSSHATWYRNGKFIGDFVRDCMEDILHELQKNNSISHHAGFIIDDYLTIFEIYEKNLPDLPHIPEGHNKKEYCKSNDWLIGFPEISFYNDTVAVSTKAFKLKNYENDLKINKYIQCSLYYSFNTATQSWDICKKEIVQITNNKRRLLGRRN
jgi:hypothetical protein